MKRWIKSIVAVMAASFVFAGVAAAQEMKFFRIGTGGAGGTYFPIGGLIANAISSPPGARSCEKGGTCGVPGLVAIAVSTNASVFNMNAVQAGNLEAGLAGAQSVTQGYEGTGKFNGDKKDKVRIIANLYPEDMHLVLPKGKKTWKPKGSRRHECRSGLCWLGNTSFCQNDPRPLRYQR